MAKEFISIETRGTTLVSAELDLIGARGGDMRGIWPAIGKRMQEQTKENFETRGIRGGSFWPDLSRDWLRRKFQAGDNLNILRQSNAMYEALTGRTGATVLDVDQPDYIEFGADLLQFKVQQEYKKNRNFPERRPIKFTPKDVRNYRLLMTEWVLGTRNRAGSAIVGGLGSNRGTFRKENLER